MSQDALIVKNNQLWSFNPYIGCDCDENSPNPDELCPANQKCKQCKCLLEGKNYYSEITFWTLVYFSGCDCDENSLNPDELCPANEKCKNCKCIAKGKSKGVFTVSF